MIRCPTEDAYTKFSDQIKNLLILNQDRKDLTSPQNQESYFGFWYNLIETQPKIKLLGDPAIQRPCKSTLLALQFRTRKSSLLAQSALLNSRRLYQINIKIYETCTL
jgi:hypothetical protein